MTNEELAKELYAWFGRGTKYHKDDGEWLGGIWCIASTQEDGRHTDMTEVSLDADWNFIELAKFIKGLDIK